MPVYVVVSMTIHDQGWVEAYQRDVTPMIEAYGGRFLVRAAPERLEGEGDLPQIMGILEFPSREAIHALQRAPEYRPYMAARQAGAETLVCTLDAN